MTRKCQRIIMEWNDFHGLSSSILSPCGQKAMGVMVIAGQVRSTPLRLGLLLHFLLFQLYLSLSSHLYFYGPHCSVLVFFCISFTLNFDFLCHRTVFVYGNAGLCFFFAGYLRLVVFTQWNVFLINEKILHLMRISIRLPHPMGLNGSSIQH